MYGGQGLTQHTPLPEMWTYARFVRLADGPDAAHRHQVGRDQLKAAKKENLVNKYEGYRERERDLRRLWKMEGLDDEFDWEYIPLASSSKL
jgi:acyl-CoA dehydrogenase